MRQALSRGPFPTWCRGCPRYSCRGGVCVSGNEQGLWRSAERQERFCGGDVTHEGASVRTWRAFAAKEDSSTVSIVDTDLVRLMFTNEAINATRWKASHYIARYIIKKRETFSRIRFLTSDTFTAVLPQYGSLHVANCNWFDSECNTFYRNIVADHWRTQVLLDDFRKAIAWGIRWPLIEADIPAPDASTITLYWDEAKQALKVGAPLGAEAANLLNADERARAGVAEALKTIYRYTGPFEFDDDGIPF